MIIIPDIPIKDKLTLTVPEAAALSGIPYKVVNAAVKSGDLESCYAGSSTVRTSTIGWQRCLTTGAEQSGKAETPA